MVNAPTVVRRAAARLYGAPRLLLTLTFFIWSTNIVLGRHLATTFPPVGLAFLRWAGAFLVLMLFAGPHLRRDWPAIRRQIPLLALLAATGIGAYNMLAYRGLHETEAINALLTQSSAPLLIGLWSLVLFGEALTLLQGLGIAISLSGVLVILSRGVPENILSIAINRGDLFFLAAIALYALYSALLRLRPPMHPLSFLTVTIGGGAAILLPLWIAELASGTAPAVTATNLGSLVYLILFPSIVAYLFFNRAVELIGANRTGPYFHLMPLFGSLLAILFLGEQPALFHAVGFALIIGGVILASE